MSDLMPCPFCGGEASFEDMGDGSWSVGCSDQQSDGVTVLCMGYQSLTTFARKAEAAAAWNTRAPAPKQTAQQAAQALLSWFDALSDPMAVGLAVAQSEEAYHKAMKACGYHEAASSARARRFLESVALDNAKLIRSLTPPQAKP